MNEQQLKDTAKHACDSIWVIRDMFQFKLFCRKDVNITGFTPSDTITNGDFNGVNIFPFLQDTSMNFNPLWEDFSIIETSESSATVKCDHNILITQNGTSNSVKVYTTFVFSVDESTPLITSAQFTSPDFNYSTENTDILDSGNTNCNLESYYLEIIEDTCDLFIDCDMSEYVLRYNQERYRELFDDNTFYTNPDRWFWNMCSNCIHPDDCERVDIFRKIDMDKRIRNNITTIETSFRIKNSEAGYIWVSLKVITKLSADNKTERMAMIFRKLSNLQLSETEYLEKSRRDSLTNLYNKGYGEYLINTYIENYTPTSTAALILIDLDNFRMVNDTFGHMTGDEILKQFARSLESFFEHGSIIARANGDKFFVFVSNLPSEYEVTKSIDNFTKRMYRTHSELGTSLEIHCSSGVVFLESASQSFRSLYTEAGQALASAKARGKNCFVVAN